MSGALGDVRICDLTGQLAGAGATRFLAAVGAQVIRVEDPVREGRWDILRGAAPFADDRRGREFGGAFNNHNVGKLGVTINLRTDEGRDLLRRLVRVSDVICENFSATVMDRLGLSYESLQAVNQEIIYVSNSGFGHTGPYRDFRSWGSVVQAFSGLTFSSSLADMPPAGWGYSYMDHHGANFMAIAVLSALVRKRRTGRGAYIDMSCTEAAVGLLGPAVLDATVNGRSPRRPGSPDSNRNQYPAMSPHGIYPAKGEDNWIAIACRNDTDWSALADVLELDPQERVTYAALSDRLQYADQLDRTVGAWTCDRERYAIVRALLSRGVPASVVARPEDRIDIDRRSTDWGLWPSVTHPDIGKVRVDGIPVHFGATDWVIDSPAPRLGQHNGIVFGSILGIPTDELDAMRERGVI